METCRKILLSGLESLNLSLGEDKIGQLLDFIKLLEKWNKAYNLTAIRDREAMVRPVSYTHLTLPTILRV